MTSIRLSCLRLLAFTLLLLVAACAPYTLVPASSSDVANFRVDVDMPWNKANMLRVESSAPLAVWTADAPSLNSIMFIGGVRDGGAVLRVSNDTDKSPLIFRSAMTPTEIVELWEATISKVNGATIAKGSNIQPVTFGGVPGFRFDFHFVTRDEVDRTGLAYVAVKGDRLYMIFYSGTKLHHFQLRQANVQRMIESARITG